MDRKVICVSWQSDVMPVAAHNYWHEKCYTGVSFPNQQIRDLPAQEVSAKAVCCDCWQLLKEVK